MLLKTDNTKFCWICGKDVTLDHCVTDKHGLSVHQSCNEKLMLLKAAALQTERWKPAQPKHPAT